MLRSFLTLLVSSALWGCTTHNARLSALKSVPYDERTPAELYNLALNHFASDSEIRELTMDDRTSVCDDLDLPQWKGTKVDTLRVEARQAAADCARRTDARLRIHMDSLHVTKRVSAQSNPHHPKASIRAPMVFLSQAGLSDDGTVAMMSVGMYCGGGLCASNDIYWFRRAASGWVLYAVWNVSVS